VALEEELLQRARAGDLPAFNTLVLEHQPLVFNVCLRQLGQRQAAEDATQEAFISAWRNLRALRGPFRPWLLRIAGNACTDELRRRGRRPSGSLDAALEAGVPEPPDEDPSPETSLLHGELRRQVERALQLLPAEQRLAVVLSDLNGFDYAEIAAVMKCSLGTVKSRIARGRARLRQALRPEGELSLARPRQEL
jgi:RNA polymerase sigma-70 factor (ECF subfamily)